MNDTDNFWQLPDGLHKLPCTTQAQAARLRSQINGYNRISGGTHVALLSCSPKLAGAAEIMVLPHERADYAPWDTQSLKEGAAQPDGYFVPCQSKRVLQLIRAVAARSSCMVELVEGGVCVRPRPTPSGGKAMRAALESGQAYKVAADAVKPARTLVCKMNRAEGRKKYRVVKDGTSYWAKIVD